MIVDTAVENRCEKVLDRVIVQIYYQDMYEEVKEVYPFENFIFTLYYIGYAGGEETAGFCRDNSIPVLTMPYTWITPELMNELGEYPTKVFVHTVEEERDAQHMKEMGVTGIYSDAIMVYP